MKRLRYNSHSVTKLTVHIVWITKYRYHILKGEIQKRCKELIIQICDSEDIRIMSGVVGKEHIHMHLEFTSKISISDIVKKLKGRTARRLMEEFPEVKSRYWGKHFWGIGYGAWTTGNVTNDMIDEYLEHHREPSNKDTDSIILG